MAREEYQQKKEYGIRPKEYANYGAALFGHKSYGALEYSLSAEYGSEGRKKKRKRRTPARLAAAAMCAGALMITAAALPPASPSPTPPVLEARQETPPEQPSLPQPPARPSPAHVHSYTAQTLRAADCTAPGLLRYSCKCGDSYTESTPRLSHVPEVLPGIEATCQQQGLTEGSRCSLCGAVLKEQEVLPKLAHSRVRLKWGWPANCTDWGRTAVYGCAVCGEILEPAKNLPPTNHANARMYPAVPATCTTDGHSAYGYCPDCQTSFGEAVIYPATGHGPKVETDGQEPTCTENGRTSGIRCGACGAWLEEPDVIPATGHDFGDKYPDADGNMWRDCTRPGCGARELVEEHPPIDTG